MKIIDLLNKIANGEEVPEEIIFHDQIYYYHKGYDFDYAYTIDKGGFLLENNSLFQFSSYKNNFWNDNSMIEFLNDEVEIIDEIEEEKKIPEKINNGYTKQSIVDMKEARFNSNDMAKICNRIGWLMENRNELSNKIDEIIDYLKSKGE